MINIVLIGIIIICGWTGYKKGIIMGIGGILVIVASLYGARLLSMTFSYEVIPALRPFVSGYMEKQLNEAINVEFDIDPEEGRDYSINDMLDSRPSVVSKLYTRCITALGIYSDAAETIAARADDYRTANNAGYSEALTEIMCINICYVVGFILAFVLIVIALTVVGNLPNFSYKLPGMDLFNDIAGGLFGIVTGLLFCHFVTWVLRFTGIVFSEETVVSGITSWFIHNNLIIKYIGL